MTRSERLDLEPGSISEVAEKRESEGERHLPLMEEIAHSIAISFKRLADRLDDIASGTATLNCDVRQP